MVSDRVMAALARMDGDGSAEEPAEARRRRISVSPSQLAGSSLAASCSALVASFLGVAGTIAGAAIGSVVATAGTAVYGPALRHGGKQIVKRLGPNTFVVSEVKPPQAATWTQTELAVPPEAAVGAPVGAVGAAASAESSESKGRPRYRKPVALAVAMLAVFGAAITVGLLAGGPIRQAGTGYNFTRTQTVTKQSATSSPGSSGSPTATTSPSASPSAGSSSAAPSSGAAATSQAPAPASQAAATG